MKMFHKLVGVICVCMLMVSLSACGESDSSTKTLVAYFSATGNTKPLAEYTSDVLGADLYEIVPEDPYTDEDLDYNNDCRANKEQNDEACRPGISNKLESLKEYDTVFIAFPIWWGKEPKIVDTFMESYDFSGKTVIPFCTSGSSGIETAESNLHAIADDSVNWISGMRFKAGTSKKEIGDWLSGIDGI